MPFINWGAYLLYCTYIRPKPKNKYAICVSSNGKDLFFFINTEPRKIFDPGTQLKVSPLELSFLKYDSYINTADFITCIVGTTCEVKKDFGQIPESLKEQIKIIVENSETLPPRFIQDILTN
jgi:hypothetical protein